MTLSTSKSEKNGLSMNSFFQSTDEITACGKCKTKIVRPAGAETLCSCGNIIPKTERKK